MNNAKLLFMALVMMCCLANVVHASESGKMTLVELQERLREKVETEAARPGAPTKQSLMSRFERWIASISGSDGGSSDQYGDRNSDIGTFDARLRAVEDEYRAQDRAIEERIRRVRAIEERNGN
jgi:hypothetical protein